MVAVRYIRKGEISVLIRLSGIAADVNGCVRYRVAVFIRDRAADTVRAVRIRRSNNQFLQQLFYLHTPPARSDSRM